LQNANATRDTDVALEPVVSLLFKMVSKQLESLTSVIRDKTHAPMQSSETRTRRTNNAVQQG